jgi:hypothetical protein
MLGGRISVGRKPETVVSERQWVSTVSVCDVGLLWCVGVCELVWKGAVEACDQKAVLSVGSLWGWELG